MPTIGFSVDEKGKGKGEREGRGEGGDREGKRVNAKWKIIHFEITTKYDEGIM